ncbi:MAG: hypothetical protein KAT16_07050, partial [Candidatus Heimdallarchaeota archaeon]|nr:hypothetical protein [Candidatus Heimdallarchaeota archaeon]
MVEPLIRITRASTSHISFLVDPQSMIFHEQDYVLINDPNKEIDRYLLGIITSLTHEKNNE